MAYNLWVLQSYGGNFHSDAQFILMHLTDILPLILSQQQQILVAFLIFLFFVELRNEKN